MNDMDDKELVDYLSTLARELWNRELASPSATGLDSYGAREAIERFVERARKGAFSRNDLRDEATLIAVVRLLERVLAVDLGKAANRKGDVPAALGLVDRAGIETSQLHRVVWRLVDEARYNTGVPGRPLEECYACVVQALERAGIERDRGVKSMNRVKKVYQRMSAKPHDKAPPAI